MQVKKKKKNCFFFKLTPFFLLNKFIGICDKDEDDLYLVTEFVAGGDLRKYLKDKNIKMPWKMRIKLAYDAACALTYLHVKGLIHR